MAHTYSVSPYYVNAVINAADKLQIPLAQNANSAAVQEMLVEGKRVPLRLFCQVLQNYVTTTSDEDIGLRLGQLLEPAGFNLLGHLVMACRTVGDALRHVQQLQALVIDCAEAVCVQNGSHWIFSWTPHARIDIAEKQLVDLVLSSTRNFGIWVTGIAEAFAEVWFQYAAPASTALCAQIFGHAGRYNCDHNAFVIPAEWAARPIKSASDNLQPLIFHQAHSQWQSIQKQDGFVSQVAECVARLLPEAGANIERVAATLNLSSRSLQRRLSEHGKNYSDILQQVRLQQATYYLTHTTMSLNEITACLGYREQSSFSTAYKAWTGQSPRALRECSRAGD